MKLALFSIEVDVAYLESGLCWISYWEKTEPAGKVVLHLKECIIKNKKKIEFGIHIDDN